MDTELREIGLTKNEAKVYKTLLRGGSLLAGEITSRSGVHRRNVYDAIERLLEKGLVSFTLSNNKKLFEATSPHRLLAIIEERRRELKEKELAIKRILPELEKIRSSPHYEKQEVKYFKGIEGLKSIYEDILKTKKGYLGYGPSGHIEKRLRIYMKHFAEGRVKAKIHFKSVYNESSRGKPFTKNPMVDVRYLPDEVISHATIRIYGDKVAIMIVSGTPLAILIENKKIAESYRKYFEVIWQAAKR